MSSDGPMISPTDDRPVIVATPGSTTSRQLQELGGVGVVILFIVLFAVFAIIMAVSNKGLCRWTNGNGIGMYLLKSVANYFTGGILGLVMFFMYDECESPVRRVSQRQMM